MARRQEVERGITDPYPTTQKLIGAFLTASQRSKTPDWCDQLELKLNKGFGHLAHLHPREIKRAHIEAALDTIGEGRNGPRSINEYRKIIGAVGTFAVERGVIESNWITGIKKRPEPDTQVDPIPKAHLAQLILAGDVRLRAVLIFLSQTGARFIEAERLRKSDIALDGAEPFAVLRTRKRRGGHEKCRAQPLTRTAIEAIELTTSLSATYVFPDANGGPLRYDAELKRLHRLCKRLELPTNYSFHQVRHWVGAVATGMGKSKKAVAEILGHSDTHATERYLHAARPEILEVLRRLEAELKPEIDRVGETVANDASTCG